MKLIRFTTFLVLITLSSQVMGQQVPLFNQYFNRTSLAYPSAVVFGDRAELSVLYRGQWSGLEGAPVTYALSYANPLSKSMGFGINLNHHQIGLINQTRFGGGFGLKILNKGQHQLSAGAFVGFSLFSINEDRVSSESFQDEVLQNLLGNNGSTISLDLSLSYRFGDLAIDFAAPGLINESIAEEAYASISEDNIPDYIAGVSYKIVLNGVNQLYFTPNLTWRYRDVIGSEIDVMGKVGFKDQFYLSGGYRNSYGASLGAGYRIKKNMLFTYHYDFGQSDVPFLSNGFNEIGLHFSFKQKSERLALRNLEGQAVIERLRQERIYDENLIQERDKNLAIDYLTSLETTGSKKQRREVGEERFAAILDEIRQAELTRLQAEVQRAEEDAERQRLAQEAENRRQQVTEEAPTAQQKEEEAAEVAPPKEEEVVPEENKIEEEKLSPTTQEAGVTIHSPESLKAEYILVVGAYPIESKWARNFVEELRADYAEAGIFRSSKRGFDYVFVSTHNDYQQALEAMQSARSQEKLKNTWVHLVRLSR